MKNVYVKTFGCQMNVHDSERMLGLLREEGYASVNDPGDADLILFNTCSIRQKAEQKFYSLLGTFKVLKERNPAVKIAVTGCIAQQEGKGIKKRVPYVDLIIGPQNIDKVSSVDNEDGGVFIEDNPGLAVNEYPVERDSMVRAWINVMYGCDNFCSYCVVPYTRGRERSRPVDHIMAEIRELARSGYKEVNLLGQNVNSYRGEVSFPSLLGLINDIDGIERIRFITSHPKDLGKELAAALKNLDKVCEHIHLPLQSGSTRILNMMNRNYSFVEYMKKIEMLRDAVPEIAITSDIIAGFPGESEEDHDETIAALEKIRFEGIFAFKYSRRPMTKAFELKDHMDETVKSSRLTEILELQDGITLEKNKTLEGSVVEVLFDDVPDRGMLSGRARSNKIVTVDEVIDVRPGTVADVLIEEAHKHTLTGRCEK